MALLVEVLPVEVLPVEVLPTKAPPTKALRWPAQANPSPWGVP
jgi:hypothetical protein